jgi:hypothetical protein
MKLDNDNIEVIDKWRKVYHNKDTIQTQTQLTITQNTKSQPLRFNVITGHPLCAIEMKIRCTASSVSSATFMLESLLEAALSELVIESVEGVEWYALRGTGAIEAFKGFICDWNSALFTGTTMVVAANATSQVLEQVVKIPIFLDQDHYGQHRLYVVGNTDFTTDIAEIDNVTIDFTFKYTPDHDARPWNLIYQDLADNLNKTGTININTYLPQEEVVLSYWVCAHAAHDWYKTYQSDGYIPFDANDATIQRLLWRSSFQEWIEEDYSITEQASEFLRQYETFISRAYLSATAGNVSKAQGILPGAMMRFVHETYHDGRYSGFLYGPSSTQQFLMRTAVSQAGALLVTITTVDDYPMAGHESAYAPTGPNTTMAEVTPAKTIKTERKIVNNTLTRSGPANTRRKVLGRRRL